MKRIFLISLSCFILSAVAIAQNQPQKISYHGQFRTVIGDYSLKGNILDNVDNPDTTSSRRGSQGSMMFDLGINAKPNENFKFLAEFRFRSVIGLDGLSQLGTLGAGGTGMIFRQVRAEGNVKQFVQYQIGDIDLGLTKYTLYNNDEIFKTYESDIFIRRREISQYESFQTDNLWRLQGLTAKTQINFNKVIQRVDLRLFGVRTKQNVGELGIPDRYLVGGKLDVLQSKFLNLGVNWTNFFDLPGTTGNVVYSSAVLSSGQTQSFASFVSDTAHQYNNQVVSLSYKITPFNNDKYELNLLGEAGISKDKYFVSTLDTTSEKDDYFIDAGLRVVNKSKKVELTASYINVGPDFTSPGAQTLRLNTLGRTNLLGSIDNNKGYRVPTIFERHASEFIYNHRIETKLMGFLPLYGNVLPYGAATPNRSGLVYNLGKMLDPDQVLSTNIGGALLSEVVSEGDITNKELRKFLQLQGGAALKVSNLIKFKKKIVATIGGRYESTTRIAPNIIDYKSILIDGGLTVEVFKDLSLLGGVKYLHGNGTEVISTRDFFGGIESYSPYVSDITQTIFSGGIRVDLFLNSFASIEYNNLVAMNNLNTNENYSLGNLFFNFTLRF